jgi:DNA recombination protein RmuC
VALFIVAGMQVSLLIVVLIVVLRHGRGSADEVLRIIELRTLSERLEPTFRDELRGLRAEISEQMQMSRKEAAAESRILREELVGVVNNFGGQVSEGVGESRREQGEAANRLQESVVTQFDRLTSTFTTCNEQLREVLQGRADALLGQVTGQLVETRSEQSRGAIQLKDSVQTTLVALGGDLRGTNSQLSQNVQERLAEVTAKFTELSVATERNQEALRTTVEGRLDRLNESNSQKLEEMRQTVDEKLHSTLEKRLTDSFGLVTEQLGNVQRGLGEMKDLASGVGDLKRVLTNIKSRGGYGEVQLEMLLDQMLAPEQYVKNVKLREGTQQRVEFAIRLPGLGNGENVLLPIDAKFPRESWERLEDAHVRGDQEGVKQAGEKLEGAIRVAAKEIAEKYVQPPVTTNFAIMFLPTEGLFAEVVRRAGLMDELQTKYRVTVAGPTTFAALLTSLQMGFQTLAIQKKGSEVWKVLGATKLEFEKFGGLMDRVQKNIGTVQNTLRDVGTRTRAISRTLKNVDTADLKVADASALLARTGTPQLDDDERELAAQASPSQIV